MSIIRVLSDHLANQIAAGEVVERPASVVKELVENALDAKADRITVQVEGAGTRLIRVADNGVGMDQDDVLLSLERHATSKLTEECQLTAITTLGFRGEALPSIGSVSRMSILSRPQSAEIGTRAEIRYGTLHDFHDHGCACGTVIEVRSLFGNLPARKKFLKTRRTELFHVEEAIRSLSLAYPEVAFSLQVDGRKTIVLSAADPARRAGEVFRYSGSMLELDSRSDGGDDPQDTQISGFLLLPDAGASAGLRILVNKRPVQDRTIRYAVADGLQGLLMKGQQPAGVLLLDINPQQIDINVHPAKREIRFRDPRQVRRRIIRAVADAVQRYQDAVRAELFGESAPKSDNSRDVPPDTGVSSAGRQTAAPDRPPQIDQPIYQPQPPEQQRQPYTSYTAEPLPELQPTKPFSSSVRNTPQSADRLHNISLSTAAETLSAAFPPEQSERSGRVEQIERKSGFPEYGGLKLIGQFLNLYLLCEQEDRIVIIDQHAAHERILYQQLRTAYEQRAVTVQNLLFPAAVELGPDQADTLEQEAETVAALGLTVEFFGDTTWIIKAVPAIVGTLPPQEVLTDILDRLADGTDGTIADRPGTVPECIDRLLASMACKAAVKSGNRLHPEEMLELLHQMDKSKLFSHCPHGRPVLKIFSRPEIEKWFRRT
ncbi:MAG: DNA mismatch repair endonuclease MutL [Candidatus Electrothrix sp. YB6]